MTTTVEPTRASTLLDQFSTFRSELDSHYDRREKLIKLSRDITALSKKLIFTLHRINAVSSSEERRKIFAEAEKKDTEILGLFEKVREGLKEEKEGGGFWRYENAVSSGIQEYLEAHTFYTYLRTSALPTLLEVQTKLTNPSTGAPYVIVTSEDYLGGLADLTGELMRLAIGMVGKSLGSDGTGIKEVGAFVRQLKGHMDPLAGYSRWLPKKLVVLDQSLGKIEAASYTLSIRSAEYKDSPEMLKAFQDRLREDVSLIET